MTEIQIKPRENDSDRITLGIKMLSPRLSRLDLERQASMADEGGMSAAVMEGEDGFDFGLIPLRRLKERSLLQIKKTFFFLAPTVEV